MAWRDKKVLVKTLIGSGAVVDGDFKTDGSARIDGIIKGNVEVEKDLVIGALGRVTGNVKATSVLVGGEVLGDIEAPDKAELTEGAKVLGDISTKKLVIDENAIFQGKCDMYQDVPGKKEKQKKQKPAKRSAKASLLEALKEVKDVDNEEKDDKTNQNTNSEEKTDAAKDENKTDNNTEKPAANA